MLQGSSWSRQQYKFITHDASPATLHCHVSARDIEKVHTLNDGIEVLPGSDPPLPIGEYAVFGDADCVLRVVPAAMELPISVRPGESDVFTVSPVMEVGTAEFAAVGLINMLNAGGAITRYSIGQGVVEGGWYSVCGTLYLPEGAKQILIVEGCRNGTYGTCQG